MLIFKINTAVQKSRTCYVILPYVMCRHKPDKSHFHKSVPYKRPCIYCLHLATSNKHKFKNTVEKSVALMKQTNKLRIPLLCKITLYTFLSSNVTLCQLFFHQNFPLSGCAISRYTIQRFTINYPKLA